MTRNTNTLFFRGLVVAIPGMALQFTFSTIDPPGSTSTFAFGINPRGDIVGHHVAGGVSHEFLLQGGNFTTVDVPGATATFARRVVGRGLEQRRSEARRQSGGTWPTEKSLTAQT
jgi:hypothetical protein